VYINGSDGRTAEVIQKKNEVNQYDVFLNMSTIEANSFGHLAYDQQTMMYTMIVEGSQATWGGMNSGCNKVEWFDMTVTDQRVLDLTGDLKFQFFWIRETKKLANDYEPATLGVGLDSDTKIMTNDYEPEMLYGDLHSDAEQTNNWYGSEESKYDGASGYDRPNFGGVHQPQKPRAAYAQDIAMESQYSDLSSLHRSEVNHILENMESSQNEQLRLYRQHFNPGLCVKSKNNPTSLCKDGNKNPTNREDCEKTKTGLFGSKCFWLDHTQTRQTYYAGL
jgi:hypothetical protein